MATPFRLTIASASQNLFRGDALSLVVPAAEGVVEILANHEPFVTTLTQGQGVYTDITQTKHRFDILAGVLEVSPGECTVLL